MLKDLKLQSRKCMMILTQIAPLPQHRPHQNSNTEEPG